MKEYEDLEVGGKLIQLPYKIGDAVYILFDDEIKEGTIKNVMQEKDKKGDVFYVFTVRCAKGRVNNCMTVCEEDMFLSREESEKALKEREKNGKDDEYAKN